jgi:hypothetical protein
MKKFKQPKIYLSNSQRIWLLVIIGFVLIAIFDSFGFTNKEKYLDYEEEFDEDSIILSEYIHRVVDSNGLNLELLKDLFKEKDPQLIRESILLSGAMDQFNYENGILYPIEEWEEKPEIYNRVSFVLNYGDDIVMESEKVVFDF